ncbi:germin-like protein subfamily 2 member 2 [Cladorrhinum sp. PSN259]|nr:germin-like protein subfamily 2 member 2 [Cladorrhinum sp. PSN259]
MTSQPKQVTPSPLHHPTNPARYTRSGPREELKILYDVPLKNCPGKTLIGMEVFYKPGGWSPPHRHAGATCVAYVLKGEFLSGMNGNPAQIYKEGEHFVEQPGCHHTVSDNGSKEGDMKAIVNLIVDTSVLKTEKGYAALLEIDEGWE